MRITGGLYRSRTVEAPAGSETRPTSDRVREALFSILHGMVDLPGARVLDLYAGTGALALEALSRGAEHATMVEPARAALTAIRSNVRALGVDERVRVIATTVERAGAAVGTGGPYRLVFADPPYAQVASGDAPRAMATVLGVLSLAPGAIVVLEHGKAAKPPPLPGVTLVQSRRYGDTVVSLYARDGSTPGPVPPAPGETC